jgi:hypothetical protein
MKSKFILTEEESKRILTLHKEKIDQERGVVSEQGDKLRERADKLIANANKKTKKNGYLTLPYDVSFEKTEGGGFLHELKLFKGAIFKVKKPNVLISDTKYELVGSLNPFGGSTKQGARKGTIIYNCGNKKFKLDGTTDSYFNEDRYIEIEIFKYACKMSKGGGTTTPPPTPTPSKKGCPSIVKSFTDAGYTQITVERYRELANDKTRIRKYKFCPVTKKNLYFAKPQVTQTGPAPTPVPDGGETNTGGGGQTYPFDYDTILKAFPPDEIINPFEQGGEEEVQSTIVTDKMYAEF